MYDVVYFVFQLEAFRILNLQRTHMCILVWITPFQSCLALNGKKL
jgi:hypothetical protein